jgi:hypothetical protein
MQKEIEVNIEINKHTEINIQKIGRMQTPILWTDDFLTDNGKSLRIHAASQTFRTDKPSFYPGIKCPMPDNYTKRLASGFLPHLYQIYNIPEHLKPTLHQAAFSIVTTPPNALNILQQIPHFDSENPYYFAFLHYLGQGEHGDTCFYRHKKTSIEKIDAHNKNEYLSTLQEELEKKQKKQVSYIENEDEFFVEFHRIKYKTNRVAVYPGSILHSININPQKDISSNVENGRLTANVFLQFQ